MADSVTISLEGVDEVRLALANAARQIRTKAVRSALRDAGKLIQKQAKANAPVLQRISPTRKPGTVRDAIIVRNSKFARRDRNEGVYISVRPLRGARQRKLGRAGANNPNDPFYWWFVEFGTKPHIIKPRPSKKFLKIGGSFFRSVKHPGTSAKRFMTRAADQQGQAAVKVFMSRVIPQIERLNAKVKI